MADQTSILVPNQLSVSMAAKEVAANEMFDMASIAMLYARDSISTTGLYFGYLGGRIYIDGVATAIASNTTLLAASQTNYVEVSALGVVSSNTTGFSADKAPLYIATTSASQITNYVDQRNVISFVRLFFATATVAMADADKTLTFAQAACESISCTGALTALRDVIVPTAKRRYVLYAGTTGGFGIRVKTASGSGVTLSDGDRVLLECDGANVVAVGSSGGGGGSFTGGTLLTTLNEAPAVTVASGATVNIGAASANTINITGTTTITAFDSIADGAIRRLVFAGALTLTHNATSLILPSGANITTAAGDVAILRSLGSGNWRCDGYHRASGLAVVGVSPSAVNRFTKTQSVDTSALVDAATIVVDASLSNNFKVTLGGNRTLGNPSNLTEGMVLNFAITQDGTGSRTLSYSSSYKFPGGVAPVLTTAAGAKDFMSCYYDGSVLLCNTNKGFA